ncbi:hypothetical protein [Calothrix sp. NIES-3974]|uniref:hypothetical protein n=1 Tax=Calothrix sp. NIES-3974 TaxID=2005462 RepID=UPI000B61A2ED|nr:hypothetical protein [Calothrix sp. NIES-3974]BAZ05062.1 hypothetical protein NIES3974_17080 [Calothrix sp. NIES-3974]
MNTQNKSQQIQSPWWRWPIEFLFPDKRFDGQFQNPGNERVFDFDDVMKSENPITMIAEQITYYPENNRRDFFGIFISGLGQKEAEASRRSRRYAETLNTGIANLHNASYLKRNPILSFINRYLDWINAGLDYMGLSGSPVIKNSAALIDYAVEHNLPINFSGDSLGTILLARGINLAKRRYIDAHALFWNFSARRTQEKIWEERSRHLINVFLFGNAYFRWAKGPKYIMVSIAGDIVPEKFGMTPQRAIKQQRDDIKFIIFPPMFPQGSFEAHNMMFTTQLLRQTMIKNHLAVGDFVGLYQKLSQGILELAKPDEIYWPDDMADFTWNPGSLGYLSQL